MTLMLRVRGGVRSMRTLAIALASILAMTVDSRAASLLSGMDARPVNAACIAGDPPPSTSNVQFVPAFEDLGGRRPFDMRLSPNDSHRYYYVTRNGFMWTFTVDEAGKMLSIRKVLDITENVGINNHNNSYSEGGSEHFGISSFAFHPDFGTNPNRRWVFLIFNGRKSGEANTTSYVARYTLNPDGITFDRNSELIVIRQQQGPSWLHHFGHLVFGPDKQLYIGSGDGTLNGINFFPEVPSQRLDDLRGKLLRINVDNSTPQIPYVIPADNPFVGEAGVRQEIYAYGLRNPWRFSFDSVTGELWLGDVGDFQWEEVNLIEAGKNYGWHYYEGTTCRARDLGLKCPQPNTIPPVFEVNHNGQSIAMINVGVYRGTDIPALSGKYLFRVYGLNQLFTLTKQGDEYIAEVVLDATPNVNTFFTDARGELYGIDVEGKVFKLKAVPQSTGTADLPLLLSQTGCVRPSNPRIAAVGTIPYTVESALWSDGASKRRWLALPNGRNVTINPDGDFTFPIGTVMMKTFLFGGLPFETRLLKLHNNGQWSGSTYRWEGNDATLVGKDGYDAQIETSPGQFINWHFPSRSECMICHTQAAGVSIGPEISQLNTVITYPNTGRRGHQLATWDHIGVFDGPLPGALPDLPSLARYWNTNISNTRRARSYLHANCSYCHRPGVDIRATMDLRFATPVTDMNICDVAPNVGDLGIPGARLLDPQSPSTSIIPTRMQLRGGGQMPPLGTNLTDDAHLLINSWIERADVCSPVLDTDADGVHQTADNCTTVSNASQFDADNDRFGDRCDGDYDNDLMVDGADRSVLQAAIQGGMVFTDAGYRSDFDFNYDGRVDAADGTYFDTNLMSRRVGPSGFRRNH